MANKKFLLGALAMALVFGLMVSGCDDSGGGKSVTVTTGKATYTGVNDGGDTFELVITENKSSLSVRYTAKAGDTYSLTIKKSDGASAGSSSGTVSAVSGSTLTLKHTGGTTFTAIVSAGVPSFSQAIPLNGGGTITAGTLTAPKPAPTPTPPPSAPPVFTLTGVNSTHQNEGSDWFVFGLFPTGTSDAVVLADAKRHKNNAFPTTVIAYAGGPTADLSWQGTPPGNLSISTTLISASDHTSTWNDRRTFDGWVLAFNGNRWNGYKLAIDVQGNVTKSASEFVKTITDQP